MGKPILVKKINGDRLPAYGPPNYDVELREPDSARRRRSDKLKKLNKELKNQFSHTVDTKNIVQSLQQEDKDIMSMCFSDNPFR